MYYKHQEKKNTIMTKIDKSSILKFFRISDLCVHFRVHIMGKLNDFYDKYVKSSRIKNLRENIVDIVTLFPWHFFRYFKETNFCCPGLSSLRREGGDKMKVL